MPLSPICAIRSHPTSARSCSARLLCKLFLTCTDLPDVLQNLRVHCSPAPRARSTEHLSAEMPLPLHPYALTCVWKSYSSEVKFKAPLPEALPQSSPGFSQYPQCTCTVFNFKPYVLMSCEFQTKAENCSGWVDFGITLVGLYNGASYSPCSIAHHNVSELPRQSTDVLKARSYIFLSYRAPS